MKKVVVIVLIALLVLAGVAAGITVPIVLMKKKKNGPPPSSSSSPPQPHSTQCWMFDWSGGLDNGARDGYIDYNGYGLFYLNTNPSNNSEKATEEIITNAATKFDLTTINGKPMCAVQIPEKSTAVSGSPKNVIRNGTVVATTLMYTMPSSG